MNDYEVPVQTTERMENAKTQLLKKTQEMEDLRSAQISKINKF